MPVGEAHIQLYDLCRFGGVATAAYAAGNEEQAGQPATGAGRRQLGFRVRNLRSGMLLR